MLQRSFPGTVVPAPDFRVPLVATALGAGLIYADVWPVGVPLGLLGLLLTFQGTEKGKA